MKNLLKAELYRAKFFKSIWIGLIVVFFLTLINALVARSLSEAASGSGSELMFELMGLAYSGKSVIIGNVGATDTTFLLAIIISLIVGGSFQNGATRNAAICGNRRINVFFTYFIEAMVLTVIYILANYIFSGLFSIMVGYGTEFTANEFGTLIGRMALQFLSVLAYSSVFVMISMLIRKSGGAIGLSIGFYIVESLVISAVVLAASVAGKTGLKEVSNAFLSTCLSSTVASTLSTETILICTFVPIAWILISSLISILTFEKRDL